MTEVLSEETLATTNGPPETAGGFEPNQAKEASLLPCCLAMCAGYKGPNSDFQSGKVVLKTTVTVFPLSDPVTDWMFWYPVVEATGMFASAPFCTCQA